MLCPMRKQKLEILKEGQNRGARFEWRDFGSASFGL